MKKIERRTHEESRQRRRQIADRLINGWSVSRVAQHYGVSAALVYLVGDEFGVPVRTRKRVSDLDILKTYIRCATISDASTKLGVSITHITSRVKKAKSMGICDAKQIRRLRKKG